MMFVASGAKGRCSFKMNKIKAAEFKRKTGLLPRYQCENDYFLVTEERAAKVIYKKTKDGWVIECKATIRTGEPVENIDWKNPSKYYEPE